MTTLFSMGVPNLATCGCCGMSLFDSERDIEEPIVDSTGEPSRLLMEELLARLQHAYVSDDRQLKLDLDPYVNAVLARPRVDSLADRWITGEHEILWDDMCIRRLPMPKPPPLQLNGAVFRDEMVTPATAAVDLGRWSDRLRPADRLRLSAALQAIRAEKNAMRRQAGAPGNQFE